MKKCAVIDPEAICIGFDGNNCRHQHTGCDAICVKLDGEGPRVILVEVKRDRCDHGGREGAEAARLLPR